MKAIFYEGLYGDQSLDLVDQFLHIEAIATRSRYYNWHMKQHVHHSLFQLFFVEEGCGEILSHERKMPFQGPCFFLIPADNLHGFNFDKDIIGTVFTMPEGRLRSLLKSEPNVIEVFSEIYIGALGDKDEHQRLSQLFRNCIQELNAGLLSRALVLEYSISLALVYIYRLLAHHRGMSNSKDKAVNRVFRSFLQLIRKKTEGQKTVQDYAAALKVTTGYLNRVCHSAAGLSSKDIILEHALNEAKEHLAFSDLSVAQIADLTGFADASYFSRLFKKKRGLSPLEYRAKARTEQPTGPVEKGTAYVDLAEFSGELRSRQSSDEMASAS